MSKLNISELLRLPDLADYLKLIDQQLFAEINTNNSYIKQPAIRLINAGGKRLRPALLIAVANLGDVNVEKIVKLSAAVELVHLASLVHDDIIDGADIRWNKPTVNALEGSNHAIIVGDYLFAKANLIAASLGQAEGKIMAKVITELCDGQSMELADQYNLNRSTKSLLNAINGKTAALMATSCKLGGLTAGLNSKQLKASEDYGHYFGLAFQLVDDLLDLVSTTKLYGKPVGSDIVDGIYSLPVILGLRTSAAPEIKNIIADYQIKSDLAEILIQCGAITKTMKEITKYNLLASKSALILNNKELRDFPDNYLKYVIENLVAAKYKNKLLQI